MLFSDVTGGGSEPSLGAPKKRVLIAEDSETSAAVLSRALRSLGVEVVVVGDGVEAARTIAEDPPDVLIVDIIMPKMNGFELCRALRADPRFEKLPIIFVTAMDRESDRYWGYKQGADEFLVKPVDADLLRATVSAYI
ncbi:MAG: response regulator [Deltaproteobacteria bacterium]|nr:response regulator [Deltaproteobacteria bacterium]